MTEKEMLQIILQNTEETKADVRELKRRVHVLECRTVFEIAGG